MTGAPPLVTRASRPAVGGGLIHSASFDSSGGSLDVTLYPDRKIVWHYTPGTPEPEAVSGGGITWHFGRLISSGPGARAFWDIKEHLGLSFGQIEAELREMSGYTDGTE
jgi:hypothetical protein